MPLFFFVMKPRTAVGAMAQEPDARARDVKAVLFCEVPVNISAMAASELDHLAAI